MLTSSGISVPISSGISVPTSLGISVSTSSGISVPTSSGISVPGPPYEIGSRRPLTQSLYSSWPLE